MFEIYSQTRQLSLIAIFNLNCSSKKVISNNSLHKICLMSYPKACIADVILCQDYTSCLAGVQTFVCKVKLAECCIDVLLTVAFFIDTVTVGNNKVKSNLRRPTLIYLPQLKRP